MHDAWLRHAIVVSAVAWVGTGLAQPMWMPASDWNGSLANRAAVTALAVDPAEPDHVYAVSGNQIFLSVDAGRVFAALPPVPTNQGIRSLAILRDTVTQPPRLLLGVQNAGVLVSADGGFTYVPGLLAGNPIVGTVWQVLPATATREVAYAVGNSAPYRTEDGGLTWQQVPLPAESGSATASLAVGKRGDVVFAGRVSGLFKSTDSGAHWSQLGGGLPAPPYDTSVLPAIDPDDALSIAAIIPAVGTYRSNDGGVSWRRVGGAPFDCCLGPLFVSGETLWVSINGGVITARSDDGGATWGGLPLPSRLYEQFLRDPASGRLYAGAREVDTPAGFARSSDRGNSWSIDTVGLASASVKMLLVDPGRALYAMTYYNFLHAMPSRQAPWRDVTAPGTTVPISTSPTIVTGPGGLMTSAPMPWRSEDGGMTWTQASGAAGPRIDVLAVEPGNPAIVYGVEQKTAIAGHSIALVALLPRRSVDGGATWIAIDSGLPPFTNQLVATGASRLVAGTSAGVWFSADAGFSWRAVDGIAGVVRALRARTDAQAAVYLLTDSGFYASRNGGSAFVRMSDPPAPEARFVAADAHSPSDVFVVTADGAVYASRDDGGTWTGLGGRQGDGAMFTDAVVSPWSAATLYAATTRGVFKFVARGDAVVAQEFHHPQFDHYFVTTSATEAVKLAAGQTPGWQPTGRRFAVVSASDAHAPNLPVCRFFSASFAPRSSHFYTPYADECAEVKAGSAWTYEGIAFALALPEGTPGARLCPPGTQPLYRAYNNFADGAPNHRYTIEPGILDMMTARGWIMEGEAATRVFACVPAQD